MHMLCGSWTTCRPAELCDTRGIGSPGGRWTEGKCGAGMLVAAFDLQGHGLSATMDGLRGHADRFDHFVDDAELFLDHFYSRSGDTLLPGPHPDRRK